MNILSMLVFVLLTGTVSDAELQQKAILKCTDDTVVKVKTAMLCMQRYSWEHGVTMQGMFEIGDTRHWAIMTREAVQRAKPNGRLAMVGSDMNIADTGVSGRGVLAAYNISGDEKHKEWMSL